MLENAVRWFSSSRRQSLTCISGVWRPEFPDLRQLGFGGGEQFIPHPCPSPSQGGGGELAEKEKKDRQGTEQQKRKYHYGTTNIPRQKRTNPGNQKTENAQTQQSKDRRGTFQ